MSVTGVLKLRLFASDLWATRVQAYAHYLGHLLDAPLADHHLPGQDFEADYDLMIWAEPAQSKVKQFLFGPPVNRLLERIPTSLLVGRQPRWPIRQILLVIRSEAVNSLAVNWTIWLAQASGAMVTVLVVVPLISPLSDRTVGSPQDLATLLVGDSLLERQLRYVSQRLASGGLEASLRLRQGSPEQQIRTELAAGNYDLVIVAAESKDWWLRRLLGESVEPVLRRANCPVLIAKPFLS